MESQAQQPSLKEETPTLRQELQQMGFQKTKIQEALQLCKTKEQAVEFLVNNEHKKEGKMKAEQEEDEEFEDQEEDYKLIFVVRNDLKLPLHKIAQFVATSCLKAYKQIEAQIELDQVKQIAFFQWSEGGQKKIVVKAPSQKDLLQVAQKAKAINMNYVLHYQLPSNFKTEKNSNELPKKPKKKQTVEANTQGIEKSQVPLKVEDKQLPERDEGTIELPKEKDMQAKEEKVIEKEVLVLGAFGPATESELDPITKHFKLL